MTGTPVTMFHAVLNIREVDDDEKVREDLVGAIAKMAPQSALYAASQALQGAVAAVATTFAAYKTAGATAAGSAKQAKVDAQTHLTAQGVNDKAILLVKSLTENGATSAADIAGMGLTPSDGKPAAPAMLPPESIDVKVGKKGYGTATASVHETGKTRRNYAAQSSPDGITWTTLTGHGKSRKLTGASGSKVWVRFALVRGQVQSEWGTPVLITLS